MTSPERIFVAGVARVYLGPVGTPVPTNPVSGYNAALREVGLFRRDSLRFRVTRTFASYRGHQSDAPDLDVETSREEVVELGLQEWSAETWQATYGGGEVVETSPGVWKFTPPELGAAPVPVMCVVKVVDAFRTYALIIPKCVVLENVEHDLSAGQESVLPLRLTTRPADGEVPWWVLTNDYEAWQP